MTCTSAACQLEEAWKTEGLPEVAQGTSDFDALQMRSWEKLYLLKSHEPRSTYSNEAMIHMTSGDACADANGLVKSSPQKQQIVCFLPKEAC